MPAWSTSATHKLGRLRALTSAERRALVEAALMLPVAAALVRLTGLRATRRFLARYAAAPLHLEPMDPACVARMVAVAARHEPVRPRCLTAALTLEALLHRRGVVGQLRLGVRKHEGRFEAHAWVEHDGLALMEPAGGHSGFVPFQELGSQR